MSEGEKYVDHHYIPKFYQYYWADKTGRIARYRRAYQEKVSAKMSTPRMTAYEERLYEIPGLSDPESKFIETYFMGTIDFEGSKSLKIMHENGVEALSSENRLAWSRFLMSLRFRSPEEMSALLAAIAETDGPKFYLIEEKYRSISLKKDHDNIISALNSSDKDAVRRTMLFMMTEFINNEEINDKISSMMWSILDYSCVDQRLMTSDRPVIMKAGLDCPDGHVMIPIGPTKLFIAYNEDRVIKNFKSADPTKVVIGTNVLVVGLAENIVIAVDKSQEAFVEGHMSNISRKMTLIEEILTAPESAFTRP